MDNNPTGIGYLKTFRALFQVVEVLFGLLVWSLIAAGPYRAHSPMQFALGAHVTAWLVTLIFLNLYMCGLHSRVNSFFSSRGSSSTTEGGETTAGSLAPSSGSSVPQVRWFVVEYILYFILSLLLLVSSVCITANLFHHVVWFVACAFSWFLSVVYEVHFCLLFRNVESLWPHHWVYACCQNNCSNVSAKTETQPLVAASSASQ